MRQLLVLSAAIVLTLQTAFAQDSAEKMSAYVQVEISENSATGMSRMSDADPGMENKDRDLLNELLQPDSSDRTERSAKEESCDRNECTPESHR
jgi:hypothetical protein